MKTNKVKTMTHVAVAFPLHHYINTNKKYRKYKRYIFVIKWFTYAIEQMDKLTAPFKVVHPVNYYKQ